MEPQLTIFRTKAIPGLNSAICHSWVPFVHNNDMTNQFRSVVGMKDEAWKTLLVKYQSNCSTWISLAKESCMKYQRWQLEEFRLQFGCSTVQISAISLLHFCCVVGFSVLEEYDLSKLDVLIARTDSRWYKVFLKAFEASFLDLNTN